MRAKLKEEIVVTMSVPEAQQLLREAQQFALEEDLFELLIKTLESVLNKPADGV